MLATRARRPPCGLTEDWIRQHTVGVLGTERVNWLSDGDESEHSSLNSSEVADYVEDIDPKTPTLKSFVERRAISRPQRHAKQPSVETITQDDFETRLGNPFSRMSTESNPNSEGQTWRSGVQGKVESDIVSEKPLPDPPHGIDDSLWRGADSSRHDTTNGFAPLPTQSPPLTPPRLKRKVPWRGKNIAVLIPWDGDRGQAGKAPMPMMPAEIEKMLKDWEELGYNVSGFNLGISFLDPYGGYCQSRCVWPSMDVIREERESGKWRVHIPDRRQWDAYVEELREAKLRALGVSLGDDEPSDSPATSALSRTASSQYPSLPFSPPIPTSSATSSHAPQHANVFSPTIMAAAGQATSQSSTISAASPASMHVQMYGKFNSRASVSVASGEHSFGSPHSFPQQASPGVWSPQLLYQAGLAKGGSPSVHNLNAIISPVSPFPHDGYFSHHPEFAIQMQRQQQFNQQVYSGLSSRQSSRSQELHEDGDNSTVRKSPSKTPEPSQFIRHNPSDSLQKEIDDAEYHLEEQIQRQLEHDDYSPHSDREEDDVSNVHTRNTSSVHSGLAASRFADDSGPILHHPQPHSRGHSLSQRPFDGDDAPALDLFGDSSKMDRLSEIETNPSHPGTPVFTNDTSHQRSLSSSTNPWADSDAASAEKIKPKDHVPATSVSKLNVEAPEFKFNPTSAFQPSNFSFGGSIFQPAVPALPAHQSFIPGHSVNNSFGLPVKSKINVTAAPFKPGQSEFSFSSSGPPFRPDAPSFTPLSSIDSAASGTEGSSLRTSIFGKIDLPLVGIVKPPKTSKAIPIIQPNNSGANKKSNEDESVEDKDGRITQGEGRFKRARGAANDVDSIPLFAEPSPEPHMPLQETSREQSPPKGHVLGIQTQTDKENLPIAADDTHHVIPFLSTKPVGGGMLMDISPDYDGKSWAPREHQQQKDAEEFNNALAHPVQKLNEVEWNKPSTDTEQKTPEEPKKHKNSLSALAKAFEFPSWFKSSFSEAKAIAVPPPAPTPPIKAPVPVKGLAASRYAIATSPTPSPSPSEAIETPVAALDEQERTSFQEALPPPQSPLSHQDEEAENSDRQEPTFEEIDAVMRHINEVENKVGSSNDIETTRWHQPSPARLVQFPAAIESLQHRDLMRSDAPSPSPRRFQSLPEDRIGHGEFSSLRDDPFMTKSNVDLVFDSQVHRLNKLDDLPHSDWDGDLSESEEIKLHTRTQFFDSHVNDLVGGLLAERLDPVERALEMIQDSLVAVTQRSNRRDRQSVSGELRESDADDEDDEHQQLRSPIKDKKMEKIKVIVNEVLASHPTHSTSIFGKDNSDILHVLEEFKEQFGQSMRLDLRGEDLRNIVEEAVERRLPVTQPPVTDEVAVAKIADLEAKVLLASQQARGADDRTEEEIRRRRIVEDRLAETERLLHNSSAEQERVREALQERDQKLQSVEDTKANMATRLAVLEATAQKGQAELSGKVSQLESELREARQLGDHWQSEAERALQAAKRHNEDMDHANATNADLRRLTDNLRLQMEESLRLREGMRAKFGGLQNDMAKTAREISQESAKRNKKEQKLLARQEALDARLQAEARTRERLEKEILRLETGEREGLRAVSESKRLEALLTQLRTEMHESEKKAQRALLEAENSDQARISFSNEAKRLEVLVGNLRTELHEAEQVAVRNQREAEGVREESVRNRSECQRLEELVSSLRTELHKCEKTATRYQQQYEDAHEARLNDAAASTKLEGLVSSLRAELHESQLAATRYQAETEEARATGLSEVQRTRDRTQGEIESVRRDLEEQVARLRVELDRVQLQADNARTQSGAAAEEAADARRKELETISGKHATEMEELRAQHALQTNHAAENRQQAEQLLLERLSLSSAKTEHLQERVAHLEERLEISKAAALAAAQSARNGGAGRRPTRSAVEPEKISPQALRESIMVLQEQLQAREQSIERLEQQLAAADPDAAAKIAKRDDEISWLRELLAVRAGDLQDIVATLSQEDFDAGAVRDAAIRLQANLQMEQQERGRRGMLPHLAATLRDAKDAASPRVAQVVAPMATAWGSWRRTVETTPSKAAGPPGFLSSLLTPPAQRTRPRRRDDYKPAAASATAPMLGAASYDPDAPAAVDLHGDGGYDDDGGDNDNGHDDNNGHDGTAARR